MLEACTRIEIQICRLYASKRAKCSVEEWEEYEEKVESEMQIEDLLEDLEKV